MPRQVVSISGNASGNQAEDFQRQQSVTFSTSAPAFSPSQLPGLRVWLDASDASTINAGSPIDGDHVSTWTDKSTNAYSFAQASDALRPIYKTNIVNGKSILRGSSTLIGATAGADITSYTIFIVTNITTFRQFDCIVGSNTQNTGQGTIELGLTSQFDVYDANVGAQMSTGLGTAPTASWLRLCITYSSVTPLGTFYIANVSKATTSQASMFLGMNNMNIFDDGAAGFTNYRGDMAEIIVCAGVLSAGNLLLTDNYLKAKYAL